MAINSLFRGRIKRIHLVGIGGIGMSGIARVLIDSGFIVSGSDIAESLETENLRKLSANIFIGHHEDNVEGVDVVVFSSAVPQENPELEYARRNNIPLIKRAHMLAELMSLRCGIAIAGAHGKTTTTSLIGTLMHSLGLDPTIIIGGIINHFNSNAIMGCGQHLVTEADESDGTFLHLRPSIAVVTNIDREHLDYFQGGLDEIKEKFTSFLNNLPFYGLAVLCSDDENVSSIIAKINRQVISYGLNPNAQYNACNIETNGFSTSFDLVKHGNFVDRFVIKMIGLHNVQNALAAIAVLEELGIEAKLQKEALLQFNGVKRRFSPICEDPDFTVIDDYAHHPTEIKAVLRAARTSFKDAKIRVLFQPHRYSRTKDLLNEFSSCFNDCDSLVITDIYSAQEKPIAGIDAHTLIKCIEAESNFKVAHAKDLKDGAQKIAELSERKDIVLTLGAGSITTVGPSIVAMLKEKHGHC